MLTTIDPQQNTLERAKKYFAAFRAAEKSLLNSRDLMLELAFKLGGILCELKEQVGHGKWMIYLPANFAELGRNDHMRIQNAARCMKLFNENPNYGNSRNFTIDSVRKFMWGYIPPKEQIVLPGDEKRLPAVHHFPFNNEFSRYRRQWREGAIENFSVENFRRESEETVRGFVEIGGRDWVLSIAGG